MTTGTGHPGRWDAAMRRALELAAAGPVTGPNPRVGCVVLDAAGHTIGEGWHHGAGTPHAEPRALAEAGSAAAGGTAVVTLEPCTHTGRTPPCVDALLTAGIARVVVGAPDPNPQAAGGVERLRQAGVEVVTGVLTEPCQALNRRWLAAVRNGRPYVIWKFAATLDGRSAAVDGSSKWITSEAARSDVHRRRAEVDAILVGTGTVIADDPVLTVRPTASGDGGATPEAPVRQPLRVVVGRREIPTGARVLAAQDGAEPALHLRTRDIAAALEALHQRQIRTVWLEGGPELAAAFWRAGVIDEVIAYLAPALLGAGAAAVGDLGVTTIADIVRLTPDHVSTIGEDVLLVAHPQTPTPATARGGHESHESHESRDG